MTGKLQQPTKFQYTKNLNVDFMLGLAVAKFKTFEEWNHKNI